MEDNSRSAATATGSVNRREALKIAGVGIASASIALAARNASAQYAGTWDKTFAQSDNVDHRKVSFANRLGITLVADLYIPKNIDRALKHPALVVGHPFGSVKEQSSGLYAQTMAERGFITVAHDASFNGESGGQPHFISSPDAFVEDLLAAVDFLGTQELVDRERIGVIGVCASGAFALAAAQIDPRLKAVATVSMVDMGGAYRGADTPESRTAALAGLARQRWAEVDGSKTAYVELPHVLAPDTDAMTREFFDYYRTPRGQHPRATTAITQTSVPSFYQFRPFDHVDQISPRPVLLVMGEVALSRMFSEQAFEKAAEPKELYIVPGAGHVDLYDRVALIPWDKLQAFFSEHLA